jgi:transposase
MQRIRAQGPEALTARYYTLREYDWRLINGTNRSLTPIYDALRTNIVHSASGYMMADETPFTVLDTDKGKGKKSHIGYMWSYCNSGDKLVFFGAPGKA